MIGIDSAVGKRIRLRRKALNLSQTDLADRIGVKFQQVQKYETGVNRVAASRLWIIAEVLQVPITYFFEELAVQDATDMPGPDVEGSSPNASEFVKIFERLPPDQKSAMSSFLLSLDSTHTRERK